FVGRGDVHRDRAERRIAGFLERDRAADVRKSHAAVLARDLRREQARASRFFDELPPQLVGRPMAGAPRIVLERNDRLRDERPNARRKLRKLGRNLEVDGHQTSKNTVSSGPWRWMSNRYTTPPSRTSRLPISVLRRTSHSIRFSTGSLAFASVSSAKYIRVLSPMLMPRATIHRFTCGAIVRPRRPSTGPGFTVSKCQTPV